MEEQNGYEASLRQHYRRPNLCTIISDALKASGKQISSHEDTAALDEFHMRGRDATRELARLAALSPGNTVLDLGCGLGGPARRLAAEFGCRVTGIDLMPEYIEAARMLTRLVGLEEQVAFHTGNMLDMPFDAGAFDVVWSQHTFMNIADKGRLFGEIRRVLGPAGRLVCYEVLRGTRTPVHYPVQWASDPSINHLVGEAEMSTELAAAGFEKELWQDVSEACSQWFQSVVERMGQRAKNAPPPVALNLVIGRTTAEKAANTARNLKEDRIRVVYGIWRSL